jgi:transcriptional regulator with XRE-family HTH domain
MRGTQMRGDALRERREALGLSVYELAQEFEVLPTTVYRWESGERPLKGLRAIGAEVVLKRLEEGRDG